MNMCNKSYEFAKTSNWHVRLKLLINSPVKNNVHMPFWGRVWLGCDPESGVFADVEYLQNPFTHCVKSISPFMRCCRVKLCKAITAGMWAACGGFQGRGKQKALFTVQWFVHNEWQITVFARPQMAADSKWAAGVKSKWHLLRSVERKKKGDAEKEWDVQWRNMKKKGGGVGRLLHCQLCKCERQSMHECAGWERGGLLFLPLAKLCLSSQDANKARLFHRSLLSILATLQLIWGSEVLI